MIYLNTIFLIIFALNFLLFFISAKTLIKKYNELDKFGKYVWMRFFSGSALGFMGIPIIYLMMKDALLK